MDKERIEAIKQLGDRLADYIQQVDERLYARLYMARNDYALRLELIKAANTAKKGTTAETLLPYDEFISVFFVDEGEFAHPDWYLARDLLMIRIIERLSDEWISENIEAVEQVEQVIQEAQSE